MEKNNEQKFDYPVLASNYYEQLGLRPLSNVTEVEVEAAYKDRYNYWKPIKLKDMSDVNTALKEIGKAKKILTDKILKNQYDQELEKRLSSDFDRYIEMAVITDQELDPQEKEKLMEIGKSFGFEENKILDQISVNLKKYNAKEVNKPTKKTQTQSTIEGEPILEIENGKTSIEFSEVKIGTSRTDTFIVKNGGGGVLEAEIEANQPWISVSPQNIHQSMLPQKVTVIVDSSKDKNCTLDSIHSGEIRLNYKKKNGKMVTFPISISLSVEGYVETVKRLTKTSTIIISALIGLYIYLIFDQLSFSGWSIAGLIISFFIFLKSYEAYEDGYVAWWFGAIFGSFIFLFSHPPIFFSLLFILLNWKFSQIIFLRFPLKKHIAWVLPVSIFCLYVFLSTPFKSVEISKPKSETPVTPLIIPEPSRNGTITSITGAKVRSGSSTAYPSIDVLKNGDNVNILGKQGRWYKVQFNRYGEVKIGYIYESLVRLNDK